MVYEPLIYPWFARYCKEQKDPVMKFLKAKKAQDKSFSLIYFCIVTVWGYVILKDTDFLLPSLGGKAGNTFDDVWNDYPFFIQQEQRSSLKVYQWATMGYHVFSLMKLFTHQRQARRPDFMEMFLHHLLTVALYSISYMTNFVKHGSVIMFLHDWADIPTAVTKCFVETTFKKSTWIGGIIVLFLWAYSRLIVFPQIIYYCTYLPPLESTFMLDIPGQDTYNAGWRSIVFGSAVFLFFLYILHIYWYVLFIRSIYRAAVHDKMEDP